MEFNIGDKFKLVKNCLGETLNTTITILNEPNNRNMVLVKSEWFVIKIEGKVKKTDESWLGVDYLEDRLNRGYAIRVEKKGNKDEK